MTYRYGIEFETLLLDKDQSQNNLQIIESDIEERLKLAAYISTKYSNINILPIDNVCRSTNIENLWIIDEDVSVDIKDESESDEDEDKEKAFTPSSNEDNSKLYHKLFHGHVIPTVDTQARLITCNEIISPPFNSIDEGRQEIAKIYDAFSLSNKITSYHNSKTSMHIHYSFAGNRQHDANNIFNIYMAWLYFEPVIMALVPKWRREDNVYCTPISDLAIKFDLTKSYDDIKEDLDISNNNDKFTKEKIITAFQFDYDTFAAKPYPYRHKTLNMMNLIQNKWGKKEPIGTIEVRIKHGSCDLEETMNYIQLFGLFMERAMQHGEIFFNQFCAPDLPYRLKGVLLSNRIDMRVKYKLFKHFLGADANQDVLNYFDVVFQRLYLSNKDPRDPLIQQSVQSAGSVYKKYAKTVEIFEYKGKKRIVYQGPRGGRYIKINKKYVSIKSINATRRP